MPTPSPAPLTWKVISQLQEKVPNAQGQYVDGWAITYTLSSGTTGTVRLPLANYNVANVQAAIAAQAEQLAAVDSLTSEG